MKLYIATLFENWRTAKALSEYLQALGHKIACPWWSVAEDLESAPRPDEPQEDRVARNRSNAVADIVGVVECDALVHLWTPENRGAWAEHGAALAVGRRVIFLAPYERLKSLWSVFSFHPLCQRFGYWVDEPERLAQMVSRALAHPLPGYSFSRLGGAGWVENEGEKSVSDLAGLAAREALSGARKTEPRRCDCSDCDER